ncbi:hypothetical protein UY286_15435 [Paenibacillus polymyxa]|uniref:hypothetical protein n=1 Tax=Paenibacillus polymyxa TaxID=1406 RepID=UPI002AB341A8|nr:hypothetical protein [Paenibacillus polymyxa]MDY7992388.1 hypothetical protein [Paenibacillus polymyxa]MDY8118830.1 hypothetical protein [Paenibacillus polymyxa]
MTAVCGVLTHQQLHDLFADLFIANGLTVSYALMGVLLLVFSDWGAVAKLNNDVHEYEDQMRRNSNIEDIEQYTR